MTGESPRHPPGLTPRDEADDLYQHAPCGYLTTDADGRILSANATLARCALAADARRGP
jgi:sigma-B regulation protein RsbU (phosphoserine phosphatase)